VVGSAFTWLCSVHKTITKANCMLSMPLLNRVGQARPCMRAFLLDCQHIEHCSRRPFLTHLTLGSLQHDPRQTCNVLGVLLVCFCFISFPLKFVLLCTLPALVVMASCTLSLTACRFLASDILIIAIHCRLLPLGFTDQSYTAVVGQPIGEQQRRTPPILGELCVVLCAYC
jgi:hypothetical protein